MFFLFQPWAKFQNESCLFWSGLFTTVFLLDKFDFNYKYLWYNQVLLPYSFPLASLIRLEIITKLAVSQIVFIRRLWFFPQVNIHVFAFAAGTRRSRETDFCTSLQSTVLCRHSTSSQVLQLYGNNYFLFVSILIMLIIICIILGMKSHVTTITCSSVTMPCPEDRSLSAPAMNCFFCWLGMPFKQTMGTIVRENTKPDIFSWKSTFQRNSYLEIVRFWKQQ